MRKTKNSCASVLALGNIKEKTAAKSIYMLALPAAVTNDDLRPVDLITGLHKRGFTMDFVLLHNRLFCAQNNRFFGSNEFDILEVYCFEGDPSDSMQAVVYAVQCVTNAIKGILFQNTEASGKPGILFQKLRKFWK